MRSAISSTPSFDVGDVVVYVDHHNREQEGEILWIEAKWRERRKPAYLIFTIRHPTYKGRRFYGTERDIIRGASE